MNMFSRIEQPQVTYIVKAVPTLTPVAEPSPALVARAGTVVQSEAIACPVKSCSAECWCPANDIGHSKQNGAE